MWWLVAAAPPLALLLNAVRIAIIATDASLGTPALGDQHVGQGLLVLAAGTTLLFVAAHFLVGRRRVLRRPREFYARLLEFALGHRAPPGSEAWANA